MASREERRLLDKIEQQGKLKNGECYRTIEEILADEFFVGKYFGILNSYYRLIRQILLSDSLSARKMMEKIAFIKSVCQELDRRNIEQDNIRTLYWNCVKLESYWNFESFLMFMEKNRPITKQFYAPRKDTLKIVVNDLQTLEDSPTQKFYGLSMPSRVGKSTINIFFLCWIMLRKPNSHSAMGGHSGTLAKGFYKELLNLITSEEYNFKELFFFHHPEYAGKPLITDKSAEDLTITLGDSDRFATITCRGIDGTWTGAIDISGGKVNRGINNIGYLYVDDLVRDREHSLNPQRMENTWQEYLNKMVDRKNDGAKELMVGTLWNIYDPLQRMAEIYANDKDYVFRKIPALDENDESNFAYKLNGFSTQYYRDMRDRLDSAEWMAKFQQQPQIREGILFDKDSMHRFRVLPTIENYETIAFCDPALGGGDFLSTPICRTYNGDKRKYIIDWIYDASSTKTTVPKIVDKIIKHHINKLYIEINGGAGTLVHKEITDEIKARDCGWCEVIPRHSSTRIHKEDAIKGRADYIKDNFYFIDEIGADIEMSGEYKKAFSDTCIYTTLGKNLHDDAPDSLAKLALEFKPMTENGVVYVPDINPFRTFGGYL